MAGVNPYNRNLFEVKDLAGADKRQRFYRAVVEDYKDPMKMGRVRVRVLGVHTANEGLLPTNCLPWAEVITDNMYGLNTGVGTSAVPLQGTWVWIFFDNDDYNWPVIIGLISGMPKMPKWGDGFNDPEEKYPYKDRLDEPDMHRLNRVEKLDKTIKKVQDDKEDKSDDEFDSGDIELPRDHESAMYPDNTVQETATGHHYINDNTPGNERIMWYHRTNTYLHYRSNGDTMYKVEKDKHESTVGHYEEHIQSYMQTIIDKYNKIHIKEYRETKIDGYEEKTIGEYYKRTIAETDVKDVGKSGTHTFSETYTVKASTILLN